MASFYGGIGIINGSGGGSGVSIANIEFDANRNLIIYLSDGSKRNLGQIDGATFTPTIVDGVLSWSNNQGLENPPSVDLNAKAEGELWYGVEETTEEDSDSDTTTSDTEYVWEKI